MENCFACSLALSGCALVLGDIPTLREIWQGNAVYIHTDEAPALAKTINSLMQNEKQLNNYAEKANEHAKQFSTKTLAENYMNIYRQLQQQKHIKKTEIA